MQSFAACCQCWRVSEAEWLWHDLACTLHCPQIVMLWNMLASMYAISACQCISIACPSYCACGAAATWARHSWCVGLGFWMMQRMSEQPLSIRDSQLHCQQAMSCCWIMDRHRPTPTRVIASAIMGLFRRSTMCSIGFLDCLSKHKINHKVASGIVWHRLLMSVLHMLGCIPVNAPCSPLCKHCISIGIPETCQREGQVKHDS